MTALDWTTLHVTVDAPPHAAEAHHQGHEIRVQRERGGMWSIFIDEKLRRAGKIDRIAAQEHAEQLATKL